MKILNFDLIWSFRESQYLLYYSLTFYLIKYFDINSALKNLSSVKSAEDTDNEIRNSQAIRKSFDLG